MHPPLSIKLAAKFRSGSNGTASHLITKSDSDTFTVVSYGLVALGLIFTVVAYGGISSRGGKLEEYRQ